MTRQTWTAAVSAVLFVVLAAVIAIVPVPYVTWAPGATYNLLGKVGDQNAISISGATVYPTTGELRMTTISVTAPDSNLTLPEVLISYFIPDHAVLPRVAVYRPGTSSTEVNHTESALMTQSQSTAVVAALRASNIEVTELPMVYSVQNAGAAAGILEPGDLISAVDGTPVFTPSDVVSAVKDRHVGQKVVFSIIRDRVPLQRTVTTTASPTTPDTPAVGVDINVGFSYAPKVSFAVDPNVGGSSAGLMFSLAIYDQLTPGDLVPGKIVAGTGTINSSGTVGEIGGVAEKIAAASRDKATIFLLPRRDCAEVTSAPAGVRLVPVDDLKGAISALTMLGDPGQAANVAGCS